MYWYCSLCMEWRADTYIKIDPRTRSPMCKVCGQWVRDNLSDGDYKRLWEENGMDVPPPQLLNGVRGSWTPQDAADEDTA